MSAAETAIAVSQIKESTDMVSMATQIVTAMIQTSGGAITAEQVPGMLREVYSTLQALAQNGEAQPAVPPTPAVPVKDSVTDEYLVCLEDGLKFRMLKRHLRTVYGMTPEHYRIKWGLPADYPMTAPSYAKTRSRLAKESGLGHHREAKSAA